jgi:hypothetical protein
MSKKTKGIKLTVKKYKELGTKKFFKKWGEGIEGVTPLQQTRMMLIANLIILSGLIFGIFANTLTRLKGFWWWIDIILFGSVIISVVQLIGIYQKYVKLKEVEKTLKELNEKAN